MKLRFCFLALFITVLSFQPLGAQSKKKKGTLSLPGKSRKYTREEVMDSVQGICMYNPLIKALGGDSVRLQKNGTPAQGWQEDFYQNGKTLHKGMYTDGHLILFKNFHDNGKTERIFASIDSLNCNLEVFYENGNQKLQINYYKGRPKRYSEFYETGLLKRTEEFDVDRDQLLMRKTWYPGGQIESETTKEAKTEKYYQKNYFRNGKVSEQGPMLMQKESKELLRNGSWTVQDSTGKNKKVILFKAPKKGSK